MYFRLLLLCLLALFVSAQVGEKRRVGLRYLAAGEDDGPYRFGARGEAIGNVKSSLRGRYGKRSGYEWIDY